MRPIVRLLSRSLIALALVPVGVSACSKAETLCELICECEHCNDFSFDATCHQLSASQDTADAYECSAEWDAWASCVESNGTCVESQARWTTREVGTCVDESCSDTGNFCFDDGDCINGPDLCGTEEDALVECQQNASLVNPFLQDN